MLLLSHDSFSFFLRYSFGLLRLVFYMKFSVFIPFFSSTARLFPWLLELTLISSLSKLKFVSIACLMNKLLFSLSFFYIIFS